MSSQGRIASDKVTIEDIGGGAKGTEAQYADLIAMSDVTDDVAQRTLGTAAAGHKFLAEPDVLASALLNPAGVAQFEAAMALALDGPTGLTATSAAIGLRGAALRTAKEVYETADELAAQAFDVSRWFMGKAAGTPAGATMLAAVVGADVMMNYDGDWQKWLVDHPGMVDELVAMAPGMLSNFGIQVDVAGAMDLIAAAYPDGDATITDRGVDSADPPRNLAEIMDGLDERNRAGSAIGGEGYDPETESNVDVRVVKDTNGNVTGYIVDVPGTKDWNLPGEKSANDLGVNIDAMAGTNTVLQKGIEEALQRAMDTQDPPAPDAPVMLVGHSQGGIVATQASDDLVGSGYNVTHVVTAGSPVGRIDIPDSVQMLSLENQNDIVAHLDAGDNPDAPNRTTVTFENDQGTIGDNHAIGGDPDPKQGMAPDRSNYAAAAEQLDSSTDPSVVRFRESLDPFTDGEDSETCKYYVTREGVNDPE